LQLNLAPVHLVVQNLLCPYREMQREKKWKKGREERERESEIDERRLVHSLF
jgi:hypothetical protein